MIRAIQYIVAFTTSKCDCGERPARWYQHQELEPLREIINQRNQRRKFGQVFGQVLENEPNEENDPRSISA